MIEKLTIVIFWIAMILSVMSSLAYIGHVMARADRKIHTWTGIGSSVAAFVLMITVIAIRVITEGIQNTVGPFTIRVMFAAVIIGVFLLVEAVYSGKNPKVKTLGMFVLPIAVVVEFLAWHVYGLTEQLTKQLQHYWVGMHVTFAVLAYSSMTIAVGLAIIYMLQERELKNMGKKKPSKLFRKLPSLEAADDLCQTVIAFSFTFLSFVLATGVLRAEMLPEWSMWYQDPKILMAAATWVVYGSYLFVRATLGWQGKRSNMFAILGFVVAIVTYMIGNVGFISNLLPSMHSYGKGLG
jgi:ABC-type uncharacterized transport system permease subunit